MQKKLISEITNIRDTIKLLDKNVVIVFIVSITLLSVSWYFANPKFFIDYLSDFFQIDELKLKLFSFIYWFVCDIILLFAIPLLIIKILFRDTILDYGLGTGNYRIGISYVIVGLIISVPLILLISNSPTFKQYFPLFQPEDNILSEFLLYESLFILFIYVWEFIFRGFMLFGLEKRFGIYSIFIQMIPFVIMHNGKPFIETFASIFGGIILGYIAIRTRSILYGFLIHAFILVLLDVLAFISN